MAEVQTQANASSTKSPALNVYGISNGRLAFAWVQNPASNWNSLYEKREVSPVRGAELLVRNMPAGKYSVEWFDTYKGETGGKTQVYCQNGEVQLSVPELATDIAAIVIGEVGR